MCSQSEYARCYDATNTTWRADSEAESEVDTLEEVGGDICCLRKNVMSAGIVMSGYKVFTVKTWRWFIDFHMQENCHANFVWVDWRGKCLRRN